MKTIVVEVDQDLVDPYETRVRLANGAEFKCDAPVFRCGDEVKMLPNGAIEYQVTAVQSEILSPVWTKLPSIA